MITVSPGTYTERIVIDVEQGRERGEGFGNGRFARKVFQEMTERHARRIADELAGAGGEITAARLSLLDPADLPEFGPLTSG